MRRVLVVAVASLAVFSSCEHKVTSPALTAGTVKPDLVCNQQLTTTVALTGEGFTPMPSNTYAGTQLLLPRVSLVPIQSLSGGPAGERIEMPDDPSNPAASLVQWQSEQAMSFTITPELGVAPGVYGITVTNPDGLNFATFSPTLTAVPPPSLLSVDRAEVCDAQSEQRVIFNGANFLTVGGVSPSVHIGSFTNADFTRVEMGLCTVLPGAYAEGEVKSCSEIAVVLPAGLLTPGDYPVSVTNPQPAQCATTQSLTLHVVPPPTVSGLAPVTMCQGGGTVTLTGSDFQPQASVTLVAADGGTPIATTSAVVNAQGTSITASFGGGAALAASFDVVVNNNDGCIDAAPHKQLTVVTGPVAFFADPEVVYNGISTGVTVYVTTLMWPGTGGVTATLTPHGATSPQTVLTGNPVAGHPNRLQMVLPAGQAVGAYDLTVADASGCPATLANALTVTDATTVTVKDVTPPFGWTGSSTAITVQRDVAAAAPNNEPFAATPRLFLNPVGATASDVAIQLQSVSFTNADQLTAVVPSSQAAKHYDLVVVNPNGTVGVLSNAFNVQAAPPPVVNTVTPASLLSNASNSITIAGTNFSAGATASLSCRQGAGAATTRAVPLTGNPACTGARCSVVGTVASGLTNGATCILRLTNTDASYFDFSALGVTDTAGNLSSQAVGQVLTKGRRAVVAAAGNATGAARFVYAIGGDSGSAGAATPFADAEVSSVDPFGTMGPWALTTRSSLGTARAFAGSATVGRYIYVYGGTDGTNVLASGERAMILDPAEVPALDISDIVPATAGLDPGVWMYRVSAVFSAASTDNPSGESLGSDEIIVRVPAFPGKKIQVLLSWGAPRDSLGVALPNVSAYNIYRTPVAGGASGAEILVATVNAPTQTWTDDGSAATTSTQKPLPLGSLGQWAPLPAMASARKGQGSAAVFDPTLADTFYVYALGGAASTANTFLSSYEFLKVTVQANGHQTVNASWTAGAHALSAGRWQVGAWVGDNSVSSAIAAGTSYVYVGGGLGTGGAFVHNVDSGQVATGGDLGTFAAQSAFTADLAGYSPSTAASTLFAWGGSGAVPASDGHSAVINGAGPGLTSGAWNSVGGINLGTGRYLAGSTIQSAFFFVIGGSAVGTGADNSTLLMVW